MMEERLAALEAELHEVEARLADPDVFADQGRFRELARRHKDLEAIVSRSTRLRQRAEDAATAREMVAELSGDDRETMRAEVSEADAEVARLTGWSRVNVKVRALRARRRMRRLLEERPPRRAGGDR